MSENTAPKPADEKAEENAEKKHEDDKAHPHKHHKHHDHMVIDAPSTGISHVEPGGVVP